MFIECSQKWSTHIIAGHVTGLGTSVSRWRSYALVTLLLAAYLHRIGRRDSATCPHCNGADVTTEHLVLHCPAHDQAQRESWTNLHYQSDPRRLWNFLEKIGAVTRPPDQE